MQRNYKIISIEGNIGSGKSTLLENLRKHYEKDNRIIFLREPVDDWSKIKDDSGDTILKKFYLDQPKYSFPFQMMAYISRLKILRDAVKNIENEPHSYIIITERCLYTDKHVFAKMLYDQGSIEDVCYQIYLNWFEEFASDYPISNIVYVQTSPENCHKRIHKRARDGESIIPLDYLNKCHEYHEEYVKNTKLQITNLTLNGNIDIYENENMVSEWIKQIETTIR